jgi:hypothetical protein
MVNTRNNHCNSQASNT